MSEAETTPTIAVTGAAGYIGSRVITLLADAHPEWTVTAFDNFFAGEVRHVGDVAVEYVDIRDRNRLEGALDGADVVLHLAAISHVDVCEKQPDLAYEMNVAGTNNVAWFCRKTGAALVFPFSMAVLGDPTEFPITVDHPRAPLNWYGRTKHVGEQSVAAFAADAFPAHCYLKSNLYGEHEVGDRTISKGTVINFFVNQVFEDGTLPVYEPGTQCRNYVHVDDVARAYLRSAERLLDLRRRGESGVEAYEIASDEDPSVMELAERVRSIAAEEAGRDVDVALVENPRANETLVEDFDVDTTKASRDLNWRPERTVEESIRSLIKAKADATE